MREQRVAALVAGIMIGVLVGAASAQEKEEPTALELACKDDYVEFCSDFEPYTTEGDQCVRDNWKKMSDGCQTELRKKYASSKEQHIRNTVRKYLRRYGIDW